MIVTAVLSAGVVGVPRLGLPGLQSNAGVELLSDPAAPGFADQVLFADSFGGDPIVVLVEAGKGKDLLTGDHFIGLASLEGDLASLHGVKKVYGPGTVVNTLALEVTKRGLEVCAGEARSAETKAKQDAASAGRSVAEQTTVGQAAFDSAARACAQRLSAQYPALGVPALNNPAFIRQVLLEPDATRTRPYWTWALPDPQRALITVRMDRHASLADVRGVLAKVGQDASRARPRTQPNGSQGITPAGDLSDVRVTSSGSPALAVSLADSVTRSLLILLPLTLLVMLAVTFTVLRVPLRLLAIPVAALAAYWTAGAAGLARLPITPATLAVLPVVLGLSTDYTLQAVNRLADEEEGGPVGRVTRAAAAILPPTAVAAFATAAGVLAFAFSPIPLVRQFALFLAIGVGMAYLASVIVGVPLFSLILTTDLRRYFGRPSRKPNWPLLARLGRLPAPALVPLALIGFVGLLAMPFLKIETDPIRLMPPGDPAVASADHVRQAVGLAGELDLMLVGPAVASPEPLAWMASATKQAVSGSGGNLREETSLTGFLSAFNQGQLPDRDLTVLILQRLPSYFTGAVLNVPHGDSRTVLGITSSSSVEQDRELVRQLRALPPPPAGYRAVPAGLAVLAADALDQLHHDLLWLNLLAGGLVLLVLLVAFRRPLPALVAILPALLAAGWATGILFLLGTASSPLTVLLAGVVVAFATEFSVLWLTRFGAERQAGLDKPAAAARASERVGPAIVASSLALVLGFGILSGSPVPMVRDFGIWSAADLALATVSVLIVLPPLARRFLA